jgi:TPR repeat protein
MSLEELTAKVDLLSVHVIKLETQMSKLNARCEGMLDHADSILLKAEKIEFDNSHQKHNTPDEYDQIARTTEAEIVAIEAMRDLAEMYYYGSNNVRQNYAQAAKYFKKAANLGDAYAQWSLAVMYEEGQGIDKDINEAIKYFKLAGANDYACAHKRLGHIYDANIDVPRDTILSAKHFYLATTCNLNIV